MRHCFIRREGPRAPRTEIQFGVQLPCRPSKPRIGDLGVSGELRSRQPRLESLKQRQALAHLKLATDLAERQLACFAPFGETRFPQD